MSVSCYLNSFEIQPKAIDGAAHERGQPPDDAVPFITDRGSVRIPIEKTDVVWERSEVVNEILEETILHHGLGPGLGCCGGKGCEVESAFETVLVYLPSHLYGWWLAERRGKASCLDPVGPQRNVGVRLITDGGETDPVE